MTALDTTILTVSEVIGAPDATAAHAGHLGCESNSRNDGLIKIAPRSWGGKRTGAGRKPTPALCYLPDPRWYVATVHPNAERWALQNLGRAGYEAYLPTREVRRRDIVTPSIMHVVSEVMWPGYVLVKFDRATSEWHPLVKLPGIRGLLGASTEHPSPIRSGLVEDLQAKAWQRCIGKHDDIATGATVRVTDSALGSLLGVCTRVTDAYATIQAEIFGGLHEITVARGQVSANV